MPEFKVVDGRLSNRYDHFSEYDFDSCRATATRLMGVVAMKISWINRSTHARYYQVIHLDYSEYGIDEYREFECIPRSENYKEIRDEMSAMWNQFVRVMGGRVVGLSAPVMMRLIDMAMPLAEEGRAREYDDDENRIFRYETRLRLDMMREALISQGYEPDDAPAADVLEEVCPEHLAAYETINYFIMRLIDHDYDAAAYLSTMDREQLSKIPLAEPGLQSLMRSSIERSSARNDRPSDKSSFPYRCRITTLAQSGYYHSSFVIFLDRDYRSADPKVTELRLGTMVKISDYESALQISQPEYLTVYDVPDHILNGFDGNRIRPLVNIDPAQVPNGWLFTVYKETNAHVNRKEFRLNDDVYGYMLLSIGGEMIVMSHSIEDISMLDREIAFSMYSPYLELRGRYMIDTPIFHTICQTHAVLFDQLTMTTEDDD
jgi:hypothetical protein